jgi:hypothetical protein
MAENPLLCTTELEAVNLMLRAIGESPVQDLDENINVDGVNALSLLRNVNRRVQAEGWNFNTQNNRLLARNGDDEIVLPSAVLNCDTVGVSKEVDVVILQGKLYHVVTQSFEFEDDLYVDLTLQYDFEDIPQAARDFVVADASREFVVSELGAESLTNLMKDSWRLARSNLRRQHSLSKDANALTDNYHAARMKIGRMGGRIFTTIREPS